jgi:DNA (cytosine-5)-methyltransferase 1
MILLELFSGIGGFSKGLEDAGFTFDKIYFSEIDKHAIANYKYNFKYAKNIGKVEDILQSGIERPNIITFGSPCQDFSFVGERKGLYGSRSSLIAQAVAAISHFRPNVFIWENVKGAFSSNNGEDFWAIIQAFANIGGYGCEWQLVNTSWILPQNRERIYLIGHLHESFMDWKGIFPFTEADNLVERKDESNPNRIKATVCGTISTKFGCRPTDTFILTEPEENTTSEYLIAGKCPRRFTEMECERLQGFPDNWTKYGDYDGIIKEISATQRYKLIGNAASKVMVEMIGYKLLYNFKQLKNNSK